MSHFQDGELSHAHFDAVLIDLIMPEVKEDKLLDEGIFYVSQVNFFIVLVLLSFVLISFQTIRICLDITLINHA